MMQSQATMYELMWWHTLVDDNSPLAYVTALQFGPAARVSYLPVDFGAGVGSGGILFARHGFAVTLADISSTTVTVQPVASASNGSCQQSTSTSKSMSSHARPLISSPPWTSSNIWWIPWKPSSDSGQR